VATTQIYAGEVDFELAAEAQRELGAFKSFDPLR